MNFIILICQSCGHKIKVLESDVKDYPGVYLNPSCELCQGNMLFLHQNEPVGDNFPNIHLHNKELEEIYQLKNKNKISQEDIDDLKIDIEIFGKKEIK